MNSGNIIKKCRRFIIKHPVISIILLLELFLRFIPSSREFIYCEKKSGHTAKFYLIEDSEMFYSKKSFNHLGLIANTKFYYRDSYPLVLSLGGSIAYGSIGNKFLPGGIFGVHGYSKILLDYLRNDFGMSKAKIWDCTLGGYTTHQARILLDRILEIKKPDLILISNGTNDCGLTYTTHKERALENRAWNRKTLHYMYKSRIICIWSKLIKIIKKNVFRGEESINLSLVEQVPPNDYRDNLEHIAHQGFRYSIPTLFITQFTPKRGINEKLKKYFSIMKDVADSYPNVIFVDVRPKFERIIQDMNIEYYDDKEANLEDCYEYKNQIFSDCVHPSEKGYYIMYQAIVENLPSMENLFD